MIYFALIRPLDAVKIGVGSDVTRRIAQLQAHCPVDVELIKTLDGSFREERELHWRYRHARVRSEWFA